MGWGFVIYICHYSDVVLLYNLIVRSYFLAIKTASAWNSKAKASVDGRKHVFDHLQQHISKHDKVVWFHCSSAGEFEQAKPVIEQLKNHSPDHKVLITFFSPSGFNAAKNYHAADVISYLPFDTSKNADQFLKIVNPQLVVFVKYEFWYHHIHAAVFRHVPVLLISAAFRKNQIFFKSAGKFYRQMLFLFRHIFVQDQSSVELLKSINVKNCSISGDTRFDRVHKLVTQAFADQVIERFIGNSKVLVAGSTWPADEKLLSCLSGSSLQLKLIVVPHELTEQHLAAIDKLFPRRVRFSELKTRMAAETASSTNLWENINRDESKQVVDEYLKADVLIVDAYGMLSKLYRYATVAWIGGGFTKDGIHNSLEAAAYGKPVLFGPNFYKYREAVELEACGAAFSVQSEEQLQAALGLLLTDDLKLKSSGAAAQSYVEQNTGASEKIVGYIQENRLLTN